MTPATRFGSWAWLEKALERDPTIPAVVVSYGRSEAAPPSVRFIGLPAFVDYAPLGRLMSERRLLALNLLYYLPLLPFLLWAAIRYRPKVVVANGVNAAGFLTPFAWFGARLILAFHGSVGHVGPTWQTLMRRGLSRVDRAYVNSSGSATDLAAVIEPSRIRVVEHWADDVFFGVPLERQSSSVLRVLFVGRLDEEKFAQCLRVCARLGLEGVTTLTAVGAGSLEQEVRGDGLRSLGYVGEKGKLAEIYGTSDVVWASADVTYVAIPGVEGLAAGCPLIVSDTPAVFTHAEAGLKVARDLVPSAVGSVVDGDTDDEAIALLRQWAAAGISKETRQRCRAYAEKHHTVANLDLFVNDLRGESRT